jgi:hypothetical protein
MLEADVRALLARHPGRGDFDCAVFVNGGRSSVAALVQAARQLDLRVLAITLDHGLLRPEALQNVGRLVASLGVDWVMQLAAGMPRVFAEALRSPRPVPICALCNAWSQQRLIRVAQQHGISAVFLPSGPGAQAAGAFHLAAPSAGASLQRWRQDIEAFVLAHQGSFPDLAGLAGRRKGLRLPWRRQVQLGPLLLPKPPTDAELEALGWRPLPPSWPQGWDADCALNTLAAHSALADYGLTHYHLNLAHYVRIGAVPWQTMEEALEPDTAAPEVRAEQRSVLDRMGLVPGDLRAAWSEEETTP